MWGTNVRQTPATASSFPYAAAGAGSVPATGNSSVVSPSPRERGVDMCKFYVNGGCTRGDSCPYSHELPDERHLDVAGLGFILHSNVHNAQKTMAAPGTGTPTHLSPSSLSSIGSKPSSYNPKAARVGVPVSQQAMSPPPRYRPPEPYLDQNLPPVLALPFRTEPKELPLALTATMLKM